MNRGARIALMILGAISGLLLLSASVLWVQGKHEAARGIAWNVLPRELYVFVPIWIWLDAPSYGMNRWGWALLNYVMPIFGLLIYLYYRAQRVFIKSP